MAISTGGEGDHPAPRASTARRSTRVRAIGSRMAAAIVVRTKTSTEGSISATATRMNRYGMPQMIDIRANSAHPAPGHSGVSGDRGGRRGSHRWMLPGDAPMGYSDCRDLGHTRARNWRTRRVSSAVAAGSYDGSELSAK